MTLNAKEGTFELNEYVVSINEIEKKSLLVFPPLYVIPLFLKQDGSLIPDQVSLLIYENFLQYGTVTFMTLLEQVEESASQYYGN